MNNQIKCQFESCTRKFVKSMGHFTHGKWFCSPSCSDKDPETRKIKEMLEKKALGINEPDINDEDLDGDGDVDL